MSSYTFWLFLNDKINTRYALGSELWHDWLWQWVTQFITQGCLTSLWNEAVWMIFQHGGLMLWGAAKPNQVVGKRPIESKITK